MATRGRKPKPTSLKVLEGNPGKRTLNESEPKPPKTNLVCPEWLLPVAKQQWERLAPVLDALGTLTESDVTAFAGYCQAFARWREADDYITEHGFTTTTPSGYIQQIPQVSIAQQNLKMMQTFCSEFGLTPSSRSRIFGATVNEGSKVDDPMEAVLGGRW